MRFRFRDEVGPDHVGSRVSLRYTTAGSDRPAEVVGRLLAWEDDMLTVVTRAEEVRRIPAGDVQASRLVPEHPKLPPEPYELPDDEPPAAP